MYSSLRKAKLIDIAEKNRYHYRRLFYRKTIDFGIGDTILGQYQNRNRRYFLALSLKNLIKQSN